MNRQLAKRVDLPSMDPAAARVEIAKDVIAALAMKKMTPYSGYTYLEITPSKIHHGTNDVSLREIIGSMGECYVCALGACFTAYVARENQIRCSVSSDGTVVSYPIATEMRTHLSPYFPSEMLIRIESAFEGVPTGGRIDQIAEVQWNRRLRTELLNDTAILKAIMQNIIDNQGEFIV